MIDQRGFQVNNEIDIATWRVYPYLNIDRLVDGYCGRLVRH